MKLQLSPWLEQDRRRITVEAHNIWHFVFVPLKAILYPADCMHVTLGETLSPKWAFITREMALVPSLQGA